MGHFCPKIGAIKDFPKEVCLVCIGVADEKTIEALKRQARASTNRPRQQHEKGVRFV
jgi:hypothetical protein